MNAAITRNDLGDLFEGAMKAVTGMSDFTNTDWKDCLYSKGGKSVGYIDKANKMLTLADSNSRIKGFMLFQLHL